MFFQNKHSCHVHVVLVYSDNWYRIQCIHNNNNNNNSPYSSNDFIFSSPSMVFSFCLSVCLSVPHLLCLLPTSCFCLPSTQSFPPRCASVSFSWPSPRSSLTSTDRRLRCRTNGQLNPELRLTEPFALCCSFISPFQMQFFLVVNRISAKNWNILCFLFSVIGHLLPPAHLFSHFWYQQLQSDFNQFFLSVLFEHTPRE